MNTVLFRSLLSLFYPHCCAMCGCLSEDETVTLCPECIKHLPRTEQCALKANMTEELFCDLPRFQRAAAFLFFDKGADVQRLVHKMKFHEQPRIAYDLAREAAYDFMQADFFDDIDLIIPIPLHPRRLRERGYNQSEWIARALSEATGIPVDTTHVRRIRNNPQQALQKARDRAANVEGVFAVNHPEELYRKHILIVDDLITTGSTVRACIRAMHPCRGARFSVFALGKAR